MRAQDPELDAFPPEAESVDRATAVYGESDEYQSTEVDEDRGYN
ncbi:MAG TPA: hypothetical protein VGI55_11695 [Solirubrobacteraceae bacterium]